MRRPEAVVTRDEAVASELGGRRHPGPGRRGNVLDACLTTTSTTIRRCRCRRRRARRARLRSQTHPRRHELYRIGAVAPSPQAPPHPVHAALCSRTHNRFLLRNGAVNAVGATGRSDDRTIGRSARSDRRRWTVVQPRSDAGQRDSANEANQANLENDPLQIITSADTR